MINALRYPGGKSRNIKYIKDYFPNLSEYKEFREPFCGGLSLSLYYKQQFNLKFKASDLNYELYCFWNILKNNHMQLITILDFFKTYHLDGKTLYKAILTRRQDKLTELQKAVDFFIINRISFSGLADSGGYSQEAFEKRFTKSSIDNLNLIYDFIKEFDFSCEDFSLLMNLEGERVFIYADPPYYSQANSKLYGKNGDLHLGFNHNKFFESFINCKHNVLITYDDSEFIRNLYKDYNITPIELQYSMNNINSSCKKGKELIIKNY